MKFKLDFKLVALLFLFLLLFLPSLFEPLSYGDECIYLTLGQAFNRGKVFYRDIHDNKPPMLYLTAALAGGNLFWLRLINLAVNLLHLGLIYELTLKLTKNKNLGLLSGGLLTLGYLIFEGRTANAEMFMMFFASFASYLIWAQRPKIKFKSSLLIGFLFSLSFLYKVPVAFDFFGILLALFVFTLDKINWKAVKQKLSQPQLLGMIAGFALPILLSILYYAIRGGFEPYVRSALLQNIGYLSSWQSGSSDLICRLLILIGLTSFLFIFRKKFSQKYLYFQLWFLFALFGALLPGRPYPHYFIEIVPSLSILTSLAINEKKIINLILTSASFGLLIISYFYYHFWWYPILPYYQNFLKYRLGQKTKTEYLDYWGERAEQNYQLAKIIKQTTTLKDRIFVWGEGSCVYALSNRLPPGRYTVNYHIYDFDGYQETAQAINNKQPKLIIKMARVNKSWPELNKIIAENYYHLQVPKLKDQIYVRR